VTSAALQAVSAAVATACAVPEPRAVPSSIDWAEFVRLVGRHQVAPLVQRSGWLASAGAPADARAAVAERARSEAIRSLRLLALQRDVLEAVAAAGVDAIVLKGSVLAVDAHDDPGARAVRDLDLLVRPRDVEPAVRALQSAGLTWSELRRADDPERAVVEPTAIGRLESRPMLREVTLARDGLEVEVHWRLFDNPRLMPADPRWLSAPRRVDVQGLAVPTLPLDSQWVYVMVHGAQHLWSVMKWLADVPAFALRHPDLAERGALESVAPEYRRATATGLLVAEAAFGRFLAPASRDWAAGLSGTGVLVRRSTRALAAGHHRPKRVSPRALPGEVVGRLAMRTDARYRLAELRLLLLSAGRAHAVEDPGVADLVGGPFRWVRRSARRRLRGRG